MIGVLVAIVALLAIILAVDLMVTFALIRRVADLSSGGSAGALPKVGSAVDEFAVGVEAGDKIDLDDLRSANFTVIFMMTGCGPCQALLADLSSRSLGHSEPVFAFIAHHGESSDAAVLDYRSKLPSGVRSAVTSPIGDVMRAFAVGSFPVILRVERGVIAASGRSLDEVLIPSSVAESSVAA